MADQLATPQALATLLNLSWDDLTTAAQARLTQLVEMGTSIVQGAAEQRLVYVADDTLDGMPAPAGRWLWLPERPVAQGDVTTVTIDGDPVTDWRQIGDRLYRRCGWTRCWPEPSVISIVYSHGYPDGVQDLQLASTTVLAIMRASVDNAGGVTSEAIDDYRVSYEAAAAQMAASPYLDAALRRKYGERPRFVAL